jgi:hypothetical protein
MQFSLRCAAPNLILIHRLEFHTFSNLSLGDDWLKGANRCPLCMWNSTTECTDGTKSFLSSIKGESWPAACSADTELGVMMEPEVGHGEAKVYTRVQA